MKNAGFRSVYKRRRFNPVYSRITQGRLQRNELANSTVLESNTFYDQLTWDLTHSTNDSHKDTMNSVTVGIGQAGIGLKNWYQALQRIAEAEERKQQKDQSN